MSQTIGGKFMDCGCFCCLETFAASEVIDWIDDGDTPLCPHCGIAAVLPGVTNIVALLRLQEQRFGAPTGAALPGEEA